jgi:hypothetical protein
MRSGVVALALLFVCQAAWGDSFVQRLKQANGLLRSGEVDRAMSIYDELQVENPESPLIEYNKGCAQYERALQKAKTQEIPPEQDPFAEAMSSFEDVLAQGDERLKTDAAYNRANCIAQSAKLSRVTGDMKAINEAYQSAIRAYEELLRTAPEHSQARHNLDHMRHELKTLQQAPPPPPQQGQGENEKQEEQEQPNSDQDRQNAPQEQGEQDQNQEQNLEPNSEPEQQDKDKQPQPSSQPQQSSPESSEPDELNRTDVEPQQGDSLEKPDRKTLEALLQSLDERDKQEQREKRRAPQSTRLRGEWW